MNKKRLLILPIIAIVIAVMSMNVWAVNGSQQNWVKIYDGKGNDITYLFDITEITGTGAICEPEEDAELEADIPELVAAFRKYDKNLKASDFDCLVAYEIKELPTLDGISQLPAGPYKVVVQSSVASNEVYLMFHMGLSQFSAGKGGKPTITVDDFSPFYVFTATSKTSPQTGDFAPAYIAMVGAALVTCGAIFVIRAKKATKEVE